MVNNGQDEAHYHHHHQHQLSEFVCMENLEFAFFRLFLSVARKKTGPLLYVSGSLYLSDWCLLLLLLVCLAHDSIHETLKISTPNDDITFHIRKLFWTRILVVKLFFLVVCAIHEQHFHFHFGRINFGLHEHWHHSYSLFSLLLLLLGLVMLFLWWKSWQFSSCSSYHTIDSSIIRRKHYPTGKKLNEFSEQWSKKYLVKKINETRKWFCFSFGNKLIKGRIFFWLNFWFV